MSTNRHYVEFVNERSRLLNLPVIMAVFMMCLMSSILLHSWSQTHSIVPAVQVLIGTAQSSAGVVLNQGDITIYIPPNATEQQGTISIAEAIPDVSLISNDTQWIRVRVVSVEFRKPNGVPVSDITFSQPVEICFSLLEEQWQSFLTQPEVFAVQHYMDDADSSQWETLPQVAYSERLQLCGQTNHFSTFALAIKVDADVPVPLTGSITTPGLVPTRTPISPTQTRDPDRRDDPTGGSSQITPTNSGSSNTQPTNAPTLQPTQTTVPQATSTPQPTRTPTALPSNPPPTATILPPTATNPPPTATNPPPTATNPPPTSTNPPPTNPPPTNPPPTNPPPTSTNPPPTNPPPTNPPPTSTNPPPTNPPPTDPPPTDPPPTDPPPTDPPPTEPPPP